MRRQYIFATLVGVVLAFAASKAAAEDRSDNEKAAIAALKTIQTAQVQYYSQFGHFASSLRQRGDRDRGGKSTPDAAGLRLACFRI
jgi:type II secretory pathway pseudopilin PulG